MHAPYLGSNMAATVYLQQYACSCVSPSAGRREDLGEGMAGCLSTGGTQAPSSACVGLHLPALCTPVGPRYACQIDRGRCMLSQCRRDSPLGRQLAS
jgi:hypothetical protein